MNIILIGFKNSGKTSVGKLLAEKMHVPFFDTDRLLEQHYFEISERTFAACDIYRLEGSAYFRQLEKEVIENLPGCGMKIIATGGGSVVDKHNVLHLKNIGKLIYLSADFDTLYKRWDSTLNPAFLGINSSYEEMKAIYLERETIYKEIADIHISIENKSINEIAEEIQTLGEK